MVEGNRALDLRGWCARQDPASIAGIRVVATDLAESYRAGTSPPPRPRHPGADPFHVVRVGNRCVDKVRRRVQNATLGHRGRKEDPLCRIRKLLLAGTERRDERGHDRLLLGLRFGDPHDELLGSWLARSRCATSTSATIPKRLSDFSTRPSEDVDLTTSKRSARSVTP